MTVIEVSALEDKRKEVNWNFYNVLQKKINKCAKDNISAGGLTAKIGNITVPNVLVNQGKNIVNEIAKLSDYCNFNSLKVTCFQKEG